MASRAARGSGPALVLLTTVASCLCGCAGPPRPRAATSDAPPRRTRVVYHVAGFGAARAGTHVVSEEAFDGFLSRGKGVDEAPGGWLPPPGTKPLVTARHRGQTLELFDLSHGEEISFDLLVRSGGEDLAVIDEGACHLSFIVEEPEPD